MRADNRALTDVAVSVADGQPVDWEAAEVQLPQPERRLVRQLRLVESISTLYRTLSSEPRPDAPPDPIRQWGGLVLLDRIGEGTTGEVYRAFDIHLHRDVAVKLLHQDSHSQLDSSSRLIEEARRLARLRHENVVSVYGAESHDGRAGLWMELVRGESLEASVKAHGPFQPAEAARAGAQICRALSAVHAAGLLHRDVKAQNVVQEPSGRLVLMDFGTGEELRRMQGSNRMVGTPLYLAPEIFKGHAATAQSDIYSLGVLLFYLLTGKFPVTAGSMADLGRAHRGGRRERLTTLAPGVPQSLRAIVDRALDPEPARRFRTANEMGRALDAVWGGTAERPVMPLAASRRWVLPFAAAALLAVTVALIAWATRTPAAPAQTTKRIAVTQMTTINPAVTPPFLAEGMTDQLVSTLGRIRALEVLARSPDPAGPGDRAGDAADAILETSLLISPGEGAAPPLARVNARLVTAGSGAVLWADTFMRPMGDTFSLQADIARRIAAAVNATVTPEEALRLGTHRPTNPEADAAFLEGRAYIDKYGTEVWFRALDAFERAVQADASHAGAHAGMARALYSLGRANVIPQAQARARAQVAAQQALQLDDALPEAHATLGDLAFFYDWDWRTAETRYLRSLELNPSFTYAYQQYADMLAAAGRTNEAVVQAEATVNLVPTDARAHRQLALMRFYHRDLEGASAALARSRDFDLHAAGAWIISGRIAEAAGRFEEAREHTDRAVALSEGVPALLRVQQIRLMALTGDPAGARAALEALRHEFAEDRSPWDPQFDAYVLLALGEHERAVTSLESAVHQRHPSALWVAVDPRLDPVRSHPRFAAILRELGVR